MVGLFAVTVRHRCHVHPAPYDTATAPRRTGARRVVGQERAAEGRGRRAACRRRLRPGNAVRLGHNITVGHQIVAAEHQQWTDRLGRPRHRPWRTTLVHTFVSFLCIHGYLLRIGSCGVGALAAAQFVNMYEIFLNFSSIKICQPIYIHCLSLFPKLRMAPGICWP